MEDKATRWRVTATKAYYWGTKIMKPGQTFVAREEDLPPALRAIVEPLEEATLAPDVKGQVNMPIIYRIKEKDNGYFNVVDSKGKQINEKRLSKAEAMDLVKKLSQ